MLVWKSLTVFVNKKAHGPPPEGCIFKKSCQPLPESNKEQVGGEVEPISGYRLADGCCDL